jgi:heterotetrameric sarcosine oxidase gamma subunit
VGEQSLKPASGILVPERLHGQDDNPGSPKVVIGERAVAGIYDLQSKRGREGDVARGIYQISGLKLPDAGHCIAHGSLLACCVGPCRWLVVKYSDDRSDFKSELERCVAGAASVFDQSDAFTIIQVQGACARNVLAKGVHLDLDQGVFGVGSSAVTSISLIGVTFWKLDDRPTFEFAVPRSFATAFFEWLHEASLEFSV